MHLVDTTLFYSPTSGGVKRYLFAKHAWLKTHAGCQHSIVVPGERERIERGGLCCLPGWRVPGTRDYRLPLSPRRWRSALDRLEPDLIEVGDAFHPAWCGVRVATLRNIPLAAFYHSSLPQILRQRMGALTESAAKRYIRRLYERCDAVFAPSRLVCRYLQDLGVGHVLHQPLGVDVEAFHPQRALPDLRERIGVPRSTRVLVYAGRFTEEKNLRTLLGAFARLGRPYHLLLIGGARCARLESNVTLLSYRCDGRELAQWIASADALVHAGTRETFGLVILEAMACGRPVVAARAGAFPELIDERVGLLAEPSARGMADAIDALYRGDRRALGAAARAKVLKQFTWERVFQNQLSVYAALAAATRRGAITLQPEPIAELGASSSG
jgi:alpha-1,6-mannosyltransferase